MSYKLSKKAEEDLELIWRYTHATWSTEQADRYLNLIFEEIEFISAHPHSGQNYSHIKKHYRCTKVKSHLIFYKHIRGAEVIEIIRILHEAMDLGYRLEE